MTRETSPLKADRLIRSGRVTVLWARNDDLWSCLIEGDHDYYLVENTPEGRWCECPAGAVRPCSHFLAAEAAVVPHLMEEAIA